MAPEEEAAELLACPDPEAALARRLTGEPLAWITGRTRFCGIELAVHPGVYVPRWHTEAIALRAAALRPRVALDLCTGCGAVARVLMQAGARVVASDVDPRAVENARANGVEAYPGDLYAPLPQDVHPDVVTAVVPYVPTRELALLQRDTLSFESPLAYDGGGDGMAIARRVIAGAPAGCTLVIELGEPQARALGGELIFDDEGDVRGVVLTAPGSA